MAIPLNDQLFFHTQYTYTMLFTKGVQNYYPVLVHFYIIFAVAFSTSYLRYAPNDRDVGSR